MVIGVGRVVLHMPTNHSLKDKRRIMKSALAHVQRQFAVSAAEIERHEQWQVGIVGFCCVSTDVSHADSILASVVNYLTNARFDADVVDVQTEIVHAL